MSNIEKYKKYFTKEYLMGPNSFGLLDELIRRSAVSKLKKLIVMISPGMSGLNRGMNTGSEIRSFWIKDCMIF